MAADDQSWLENVVEDRVLAGVVRIQAWVKGCVVRKQMKEIRQLYEDIVHDLDGIDMNVVWSHDHVSCPRIRKVKKEDLKVVEHETCSRLSNQRLVPSGSVPSETKIQAAESLVSVSTSTQLPCQTSFAVHSHGMGADQCQQITEREDIVQMIARIPPMMGTNATCSSTQTQECDFSVPQTQDMSGQWETAMSQMTDVTPHGPVADYVNKTKGVFCQQLPSRDGISPSAGATSRDGTSLLESARSTADCATVLGSRISAERTADTIVDGRVENDGSAEKLPPEKLPADVVQPHQHFEKPHCETVSNKLASLEPRTGDKSTGQAMREASGVECLDLPTGRHQLLQLQNSIAMEMMWVQQAISSRKHYLRLKEQLQ